MGRYQVFSLLAPVNSRACLDALALPHRNPAVGELCQGAHISLGNPFCWTAKHMHGKNQPASVPKIVWRNREGERSGGNVKVLVWQWRVGQSSEPNLLQTKDWIWCQTLQTFAWRTVKRFYHTVNGLTTYEMQNYYPCAKGRGHKNEANLQCPSPAPTNTGSHKHTCSWYLVWFIFLIIFDKSLLRLWNTLSNDTIVEIILVINPA